MNDVTFIVFGASGDLTKRKLLPALYAQFAAGAMQKFLVIGASIDEISADQILERARPFIKHLDEAIFKKFSDHFYYKELDFTDAQSFSHLNAFIADGEKKHGLSGKRLIYFAIASTFYANVTIHCAQSGIAERKEINDPNWHRLIYEKPFGYDGESAHAINACIAQHFNETQIYRIDHFLTKELVGNIALVRFTNCVFEPLWNNRYIDNVQISVSEQVGIEDRGRYYDHYGALKDMVQNHMLELVALLGMEAPEQLSGDYIRQARARVLQKLRFSDIIFGQYDGYTSEAGVRSGSQTETFVALQLYIDNPRWAGIPFYLKTGKKLDKTETVIQIKFKQVDCLLARKCPSDTNYLTIRVSPDPAFSLTLNAKKPGVSNEVVPVNMDFCHSCLFGEAIPDSYEILLQEIVRGEQAASVRFDEIEYAWKFIDSIDQTEVPLYSYRPGSSGPKELEHFAYKHGVRLRS
jgi:glucose-6-phosphate 1-dehydrogenase